MSVLRDIQGIEEVKLSVPTRIRVPLRLRRRQGRNRQQRGVNVVGVNPDMVTLARMPLFPLRKRVKLPYNETVSVTSGAGSAGVYVFSLNGLYDPNITGTGHQPSGFDQLMAFYNHYTVHSCLATVTVRPGTSGYGGTFGLSVRGASTTVTNPSQLVEDGYLSYEALSIPAAGSMIRTFRIRCDIGKFDGVDDVMDESSLRGDVAANPTEQTYLHLSYWNEADLTAIFAVCNVLLEYDATFTEPRAVSQS